MTWLLGYSLLTAACRPAAGPPSSQPEPPPSTAATQLPPLAEAEAKVATEGHTLLRAGDVAVFVAPGSVPAGATVHISVLDRDDPRLAGVTGALVGAADVRVEAELTQPIRIELTLPFEDRPLEVYHWSGSGWEEMPSAWDRNTVSTWADDFSTFAWVEAELPELDEERAAARIQRLLRLAANMPPPDYVYDWEGGFTEAVTYEWMQLIDLVDSVDRQALYDSLYWAGFGYHGSALDTLQQARDALAAGRVDLAYEQAGQASRYLKYADDSWRGADEVHLGNLDAAYEVAKGLKSGTEWALRVGGLGASVAYAISLTSPIALQLFDRLMIGVNFGEDLLLEGADQATKDALAAVVVEVALDGVQFEWEGFSEPMTISSRVGFGFGRSGDELTRTLELLQSTNVARKVYTALSETTAWGLAEGGTTLLQWLFAGWVPPPTLIDLLGDAAAHAEALVRFDVDLDGDGIDEVGLRVNMSSLDGACGPFPMFGLYVYRDEAWRNVLDPWQAQDTEVALPANPEPIDCSEVWRFLAWPQALAFDFTGDGTSEVAALAHPAGCNGCIGGDISIVDLDLGADRPHLLYQRAWGRGGVADASGYPNSPLVPSRIATDEGTLIVSGAYYTGLDSSLGTAGAPATGPGATFTFRVEYRGGSAEEEPPTIRPNCTIGRAWLEPSGEDGAQVVVSCNDADGYEVSTRYAYPLYDPESVQVTDPAGNVFGEFPFGEIVELDYEVLEAGRNMFLLRRAIVIPETPDQRG